MSNVPPELVEVLAEALWPWATPTPPWCRTQVEALLATPAAVELIVEWNESVKEQQRVASE